MKKVFEAKMSIEFMDRVSSNGFKETYPFASSDGISGDLVLSDIIQENDKTLSVIVSILTNRKRMYPDFESYLELIKTTVGGGNKLSVTKMTGIETYMVRVLNGCEVIEGKNNYQIVKDEDCDFLVINQDLPNQKVIDYFQTLKDAQKFLETK